MSLNLSLPLSSSLLRKTVDIFGDFGIGNCTVSPELQRSQLVNGVISLGRGEQAEDVLYDIVDVVGGLPTVAQNLVANSSVLLRSVSVLKLMGMEAELGDIRMQNWGDESNTWGTLWVRASHVQEENKRAHLVG